MPQCPREMRYLWEWFCELSSERSGDGFGPCPISSEKIEAWSRLNGFRLEAFEREALRLLDRVYMSQSTAKSPGKSDGN